MKLPYQHYIAPMPKCAISECDNLTQYRNTKIPFCSMHHARIKRHGYPELKQDAYQVLEKLPHAIVDKFIRENCKAMNDQQIVNELKKKGIEQATIWTVKYRRRKLGFKKYLYGEIQKHKAWIRAQAIKKYGDICELCDYHLSIDTHHIIPKKDGGPHEIDNLTILCPNCHALITRKQIILNNRQDIPLARQTIANMLRTPPTRI